MAQFERRLIQERHRKLAWPLGVQTINAEPFSRFRSLHESRQLITGNRRPLVERDVHATRSKPPIDVAEIEAFESRHKIALPEDHRYFITEIGNGALVRPTACSHSATMTRADGETFACCLATAAAFWMAACL